MTEYMGSGMLWDSLRSQGRGPVRTPLSTSYPSLEPFFVSIQPGPPKRGGVGGVPFKKKVLVNSPSHPSLGGGEGRGGGPAVRNSSSVQESSWHAPPTPVASVRCRSAWESVSGSGGAEGSAEMGDKLLLKTPGGGGGGPGPTHSGCSVPTPGGVPLTLLKNRLKLKMIAIS